jgi:excisionase family DNA binding protein
MRVREVAEAIGQHPASVYRRVAAGELASVRLGSSPKAPIRIPSSAFEAFIHERKSWNT